MNRRIHTSTLSSSMKVPSHTPPKARLYLALAAILLAAILPSCTSVIEVDIDAAAPRLVIEAEVHEGPGPHEVFLTMSAGIDQASTFPAAAGATVVITDDAGQSDTLTEAATGYFITSHLQGIPGRTYHLSVDHAGTSYTASSTMPQPVAIDSIYNISASAFGTMRYPVFVVLEDPANVRNQYRFISTINGNRRGGSIPENDELFNGEKTELFLSRLGASLSPGDSLRVEMQCIDQAVFNYFDSFAALGDGPGSSSAPANPYSNISGGAMGYFNACTRSFISLVIR